MRVSWSFSFLLAGALTALGGVVYLPLPLGEGWGEGAVLPSLAKPQAASVGSWPLTLLPTVLAFGPDSGPGQIRPAVLADPQSPDAPPAFARTEQAPKATENVGIEEHLGEQVPLDLSFKNEQGKPVRLADLIRDDKPVIINLGYYGCPMLCGLVTNGLIESLKQINLQPGTDFTVITVSIDPSEQPILALHKKRSTLEALEKPEAAPGWHFLTGQEDQIKKLAAAVGFGYRWDDAEGQFIHPAVIVLLSPDGKVSRYLYGVKYPSKTLHLSLVEASQGKTGSTTDRILLFCFDYDPTTGNYSLAAMNLMRLGSVLTVLALTSFIVISSWKHKRAAEGASSSTPKQPPDS